MHKKMFRRGYIAMLAVDSEHRRKSIGEISTCVFPVLNNSIYLNTHSPISEPRADRGKKNKLSFLRETLVSILETLYILKNKHKSLSFCNVEPGQSRLGFLWQPNILMQMQYLDIHHGHDV